MPAQPNEPVVTGWLLAMCDDELSDIAANVATTSNLLKMFLGTA
jgi:hypothetical protein